MSSTKSVQETGGAGRMPGIAGAEAIAGPARRPVTPLVQAGPAGRTSTYRATSIVFQREVFRFLRDRMRIASALMQPVLFLLVLASGLSALTAGTLPGTSLRAVMFPGTLVMAVLFTAVFSAGSIGWDREFGFLREMLVAPIGRGSIVLGKVSAGAATAGAQGLFILVLAGLADVPYDVPMLLAVFGETLLLAFTMAAFGALLATRMKSVQGFMAVTQMSLMPLFFASGALFPLAGLPGWLRVATLINPLTYCVDPIRRTVLASLHLRGGYGRGVTWNGWQLPLGLELAVVAVLGLAMLWIAIAQFRKIQ